MNPLQYKTLLEMTRQKTGIVIYHESEVIVCNWEAVCHSGGLPFLSTDNQLVSNNTEIVCDDIFTSHDIRRVIPVKLKPADPANYVGITIVYDPHGHIPALWGHDIGKGAKIYLDRNKRPISIGGTVYILYDGTKIIAPDDWP